MSSEKDPFDVSGNYRAAGDGGGFLITLKQDGLEGEVTGNAYPGGQEEPMGCSWDVGDEGRWLILKIDGNKFRVRPGKKDDREMLLGQWFDDDGDSGEWNLSVLPDFPNDFKANDLAGRWFAPSPPEIGPLSLDIERDGDSWKGLLTLGGGKVPGKDQDDEEKYVLKLSTANNKFTMFSVAGHSLFDEDEGEEKEFEAVFSGLALKLQIGDDSMTFWRSA
eukprot:CAMPEP_0197683378 /NCGR_PEP_ID=MMETSP1338-20131121/97847_1 /TAXON_ID=43686 ORGANISM="Pelagodinium beii, Strain RCC1491" /NCGR_SAMPLE_ID=MMETSP1338 /ASSEMBLY_ACC=CAM_ASM_000754 /LENGTH=219 /DNA_ID=CAMNT_0043264961 /DNA_START=45 /DNA_END=704 /DNA_ORIENTATION=-